MTPAGVGAAIVRDGRVLAARRRATRSGAGPWEFPGGKVEPGESEPQALVRELREELSVDVQVLDPLGRVPLPDGGELSVCLCRLVGGRVQAGHDHDQVRWLTADELSSVRWLEADLLLLDAVAAAMCRE
jgi:8-oxo-dGTP diphosphatase